MLSKKFLQTLKEAEQPYYEIAWRAGLKPSQMYKFTAGVERPERGDQRIEAICRYLRFPLSEAFAEDKEEKEEGNHV